MLRLIRAELKKMTVSKFFLVTAVLVGVVYIVMLLQTLGFFDPEGYFSTASYENKLFQQYQGQSVDDCKNEIYNEYSRLESASTDDNQAPGQYGPYAYQDRLIYQKLHEQVKYFDTYHDTIKLVLQNAMKVKQKQLDLSPYTNEFLVRQSDRVIEAYQYKKDFSIYNSSGWTNWLGRASISVMDFLLLAFLVVVIAPVFCSEHEKGAFYLVFSSRRGRGKTFLAKLLACTIFTLAFTLILLIIKFAVYSLRFDMFAGLLQPLQSIPDFQMCPYSINILQTLLLLYLFRILFYLVVVFFTLLVSCLFKSVLFPFIIGGAMSISLLFLQQYAAGYQVGFSDINFSKFYLFKDLQTYSFTALYNPLAFFEKFDVVNLFGFPVYRLTVNIALTLLLIAVLITLAYFAYTRQVSLSSWNPVRLLRKKSKEALS